MPTPGIESKIRRAKTLFITNGYEILAESHLPVLLSDYRKAIRNTQLLMIDSGVVDLCSSCATEEHGSCCAKWVEDWYDDWLLFINLLMGAEIEFATEDAKSCSFVGPHGCRLLARHSFCVNFLCPAVGRSLGGKTTEKLLAVSGTELFAGWVIEQELRKWLSRKEAA